MICLFMGSMRYLCRLVPVAPWSRTLWYFLMCGLYLGSQRTWCRLASSLSWVTTLDLAAARATSGALLMAQSLAKHTWGRVDFTCWTSSGFHLPCKGSRHGQVELVIPLAL